MRLLYFWVGLYAQAIIEVDHTQAKWYLSHMNDISYAWYTSQYPFDEALCGWCALSHHRMGCATHPDLGAQVKQLSKGFDAAIAMDKELHGAKLIANDWDSARKFSSLNDYLTRHYDEIVKIRELFKEYYAHSDCTKSPLPLTQ